MALSIGGGFLRKLMRVKRQSGETLEKYLGRAARVSRELYIKLGYQLVPELVLTAQHRLAAGVSGRLGPEDPAPGSIPRLFLRSTLLLFPDMEWQVEIQEHRDKKRRLGPEIGYQNVALEAGGRIHRANWKRRAMWEDFLNKYVGPDWRIQAALPSWSSFWVGVFHREIHG